MSRKERLVSLTLSLKSLQLTCHIYYTIAVIAYIQWYHSYRVTCYQILIQLHIIKTECKDTAQTLHEWSDVSLILLSLFHLSTPFAVKGKNHLTVTACLKLVFTFKRLAYVLMIVNLTIHSQHLFLVGREQRLSSRLWINNGKSLMCKYCGTTTIYSTPVRSTVTYLLTHSQCFLP